MHRVGGNIPLFVVRQMEASTSSVTSPLRTDIEDLIADRITTIREEWRNQIRAEIRAQIPAKVQAEIQAEVQAEIKAEIRAEIRAQVGDEMKAKMDLLRDELRAEFRKFRTQVASGRDRPPTQAADDMTRVDVPPLPTNNHDHMMEKKAKKMLETDTKDETEPNQEEKEVEKSTPGLPDVKGQ